VTLGKVLLALLAIWLVITVIGIVIKGLFWLFVIGLVLFLITAASSARRNNFLRR
jgi:type IV secretory pathway VirB3-like protein